jgi:SpoVK/Ycf46/Vps4 family AAA+-type ATPase
MPALQNGGQQVGSLGASVPNGNGFSKKSDSLKLQQILDKLTKTIQEWVKTEYNEPYFAQPLERHLRENRLRKTFNNLCRICPKDALSEQLQAFPEKFMALIYQAPFDLHTMYASNSLRIMWKNFSAAFEGAQEAARRDPLWTLGLMLDLHKYFDLTSEAGARRLAQIGRTGKEAFFYCLENSLGYDTLLNMSLDRNIAGKAGYEEYYADFIESAVSALSVRGEGNGRKLNYGDYAGLFEAASEHFIEPFSGLRGQEEFRQKCKEALSKNSSLSKALEVVSDLFGYEDHRSLPPGQLLREVSLAFNVRDGPGWHSQYSLLLETLEQSMSRGQAARAAVSIAATLRGAKHKWSEQFVAFIRDYRGDVQKAAEEDPYKAIAGLCMLARNICSRDAAYAELVGKSITERKAQYAGAGVQNPGAWLLETTMEDVRGYGHIAGKISKWASSVLWTTSETQVGRLPRAVLVHGLPGSGKSTIIDAVVNENLGARRVDIDARDMLSAISGQTANNLRVAMGEGESARPTIYVLHNMQLLTQAEHGFGHSQEQHAVFETLSSLLESLRHDRSVLIAETSQVDSVPQILRRPGRFGEEHEIPIPNEKMRREILEFHLRDRALAHDASIENLIHLTLGYGASDIVGLCEEAATNAVNRQELFSEDLSISLADFEAARKDVKPSIMKGLAIELPEVTLADVGGLEDVKQRVVETIEWPLSHADEYTRLGVERPRDGFLFYGPPGTGKTYLAKAIAGSLGINFLLINGPEVLNSLVGKSEENVRDYFRIARQAAPCVLFIDEADAILSQRGRDLSSSVKDGVVNMFLTELDGVIERKGVTVIIATNRKNLIDDAVMRSGRVGVLVEFKLPTAEEREEILNIHTGRMKRVLSQDEFDAIVQGTEGMSGADIASVCREAGIAAVREGDAGGIVEAIEARHFMAGLEEVQRRLVLRQTEDSTYPTDFRMM